MTLTWSTFVVFVVGYLTGILVAEWDDIESWLKKKHDRSEIKKLIKEVEDFERQKRGRS